MVQIGGIGGTATASAASFSSSNLNSVVRPAPREMANLEVSAKPTHTLLRRHSSGKTRTHPTVTLSTTQETSSLNWAGYVLMDGSYQEVGAEWTVPTLNCNVVPNGSTSDWVGVDGWVQPADLFQAGTSSMCAGGSQSNSAVWSDGALDYVWQDQFSVNAGDVISASVVQTSSGAWRATVYDMTSGQSTTASEPAVYAGSSVEWVAEDPGTQGSMVLAPLADFGTVTFTNLGVSPSSALPYSDPIEMLHADGSVEAMPNSIQGASFTVTYG
jgi:hypothetical protein